MNIRQILEQREYQLLRPEAAHVAETRGRERNEPEHDYRTAYQRDRDRILHSKAFRRLKRKTQVFLAPDGDHYRTRLTHTLEASQIARTVARALMLNEDLTEAIALGHDLGHTPFGHAGESILNELYPKGFAHAAQSLRVVDHLESSRGGKGLNLTHEVRDGILCHSKGRTIFNGKRGQMASTLEGRLFSVCDAIAYVNHDIDDAIRAGVIVLEDLPREAIKVLGNATSDRINTMVVALIESSRDSDVINMSPEVLEATNELRTYMYQNVYPNDAVTHEIDKARRLLGELYTYLIKNPIRENTPVQPGDTVEQCTVDFLAGMTDPYALQLYQRIFFPVAWHDPKLFDIR